MQVIQMHDFNYCVPDIILGIKCKYSEQNRQPVSMVNKRKEKERIPDQESLNAHLHVFPCLRLLKHGLSRNHILFFQITWSVWIYEFISR